MNYVATFYTHAAALMTDRAMKKHGIASRLAPVPRDLSSSCGTCVRYQADDPCFELLDRDAEQVAQQTETGYRIIRTYE